MKAYAIRNRRKNHVALRSILRYLSKLSWKRLSGYIAILAVIAFLAWFFRPSAFPIANVKIFGNLHYLSEDKVASLVAPHISNGFFAVKVSNLRQQLVELPWVDRADVRRVWPGQVVIRIQEHIPVAFWQEDGILSSKGYLFYPDDITKVEANLPFLYGPQSQQNVVWTQYHALNSKVRPLGLQVVRCQLASRGAWSIQLSNGIAIVLGTQDINERFERFVIAYQKALENKQDQIDYVDLRYTSGMSVGWR